jgi:hypothetical protein
MPKPVDEAVRVIAQHALVEYASGQPRDRKGRFSGTGGGGGGGGVVDPNAPYDAIGDPVMAGLAKNLYGDLAQYDKKGDYIPTSPSEKKAAARWVESDGYKAIQAAQSGERSYEIHGEKRFVHEGDVAQAAIMTSLTQRARTTEDLVVSRGIKVPPTGKSALVAAVEQAGVGGTIQIPKFTATSKNPMVAVSFSTKQIVRIAAPKGTRALDFDLIKHGLPKGSWGNQNNEREVLFPPGARFRVVDIKRGAVEGSIFIDLVALGD